MIPRMWGHQREALAFIDQRLTSTPGTGVGIWAGMGSGKSRIAIEAIRKYDLKRVLILAPKSVTEHVWSDQVEEWAPEYTCLSLGSGSVDARCKKIQHHADTERLIVVLNYDVVYRKQAIRVLGSMKWDGLILDEAAGWLHGSGLDSP
jgi:superfamily II DNA or RNA helicase